MKVKFELPSGMDVRNVQRTDTGFEWDVVAFKGQPVVNAGLVTVTGDGGMENKVALRVSGRTGSLTAVKLQTIAQAKVEFDLPPAEFERRQATRPKPPNAGKGFKKETQVPTP